MLLLLLLGNGPSGISLSYILAGHWPYYNGEPHSDEALNSRLAHLDADTSLVLQVGDSCPTGG